MAYLTSGRNKIMGSSVSTDANVVTVIDESSTDEQVPSALATKAYVDSKDSYSKDEVDTLLVDKANTSDTYNKTEIDALLDGKANTDDVTTNGYTKEEVDDLLANKADSSAIVDAYTKGEVDTLLTAKADATALDNYVLSDELDDYALTSSVYNKTEIDDLLTDKVNTTSVVTTLSSTNVDAEIPSAKAVYDAIQNVSAGVPADVYSKTEVDDLLAHKADSTDIIDAYTKEEVDNLLNAKVDTDDVVDAYSKEEVNNLLDGKADSTDIVDAYTKTEVDTLLTGKADTSAIIDAYNKTEVDDLLANKADTSAIIDAYTKDETNDLLDTKVNVVDLVDSYSKTEVDNLLADKVNTDDLVDAYSKTEVDGLLNTKVDTSDVVTALSSSSTDEEIPSAKTVFDAIQNVSAGVPADVYSKTEVDNLLGNKADSSAIIDAYTKTEVNNLLGDKVNTDDVYSKTDVDDLLADKANTTDIIDAYNKTEVDALLANKANTSAIIDAYTKTEVNDLLDDKANVDDIIDAYTKTEVDGLLTAKVDSANIVTALSSSSTDTQIPSAKTVFDAIESVSAGVPADVYSKTEVDTLLADKANTDAIIDAYTKTEVNNLLSSKANTADLIDAYSKSEVDALLDDKEVKISTEENNKIEIKDDGIFVSKDYVEITQAEYDLLTEEEKVDIVFYIKDATGNTELVTVINENSTDEQVPTAKAVHTAIQNVTGGVPADVYSKTEVNNLLADKANTDDIVDAYTKTEVDDLLDSKADSSSIIDAYNKTEVDDLLADKVNVDDLVETYSKTEVDDLLADKADSTALDSKVNKTAIVTSVSNASTDEEIPSAKFIYNELDTLSNGVATNLENINLANESIDEIKIDLNENTQIIEEHMEMVFDTLNDLKTSENLKDGIIVKTLGHFSKNDKGGASYLISTEHNDWSVELGNGLYANIVNKDFVNYRMFGAMLDGITDDYTPILKAHTYCNANSVLLKNDFGIIYKENAEQIPIKYDVDLTGSTVLINNTNCNGFYQLKNDDDVIYAYKTTIKPELTKDTSYFVMDENDLPYNCVLHVSDNNAWSTRNDAGYFYENFRADLMYHTVYGYCTGALIQGYDDADTDLEVKYTKYNSRRLTFKGCEVRVETTPNVTVGAFRIYRHNVLLCNFHVKTKPSSLGNQDYKGTLFEIKDAYNVQIDNVVGTNIAGNKDSRTGSGYTIRLLNTYKTDITNCNITGFWGCTGIDNAKDITFRDCTLNRVDVHEYFSNLTVDNCVIYDWGVNIGYGTGLVKVVNSKFIFLDKPNMGGSTIFNINNSYGLLFDGDIVCKDCEIVKSNKEVSLIKVNYIEGLGTSHRTRVKLPNVSVENIIVRNTVSSQKAFTVFNFTGTSDSSGDIDRPEYINISNVSVFNDDYTRGSLNMVNDTSSVTYSDRIKTKFSMKDTIFGDDPVTTPLASDGLYIDIYQATNNTVHFRTRSGLLAYCDVSLDNCSLVLYNDNSETNLFVNNCMLYAFAENNATDIDKIKIVNSNLRVFGYNAEYDRATIQCGRYMLCDFLEYTYTKPDDATIYTSNFIKGSTCETYNTSLDVANLVDAYSKTEVDDLLADKANVDDIVDSYTKTETDGLLATKANATALDDYVTNNSLTSTLSNYPTNSSLAITLSDYATYSDLNSYATKTSVTTNTANIATNTARIDNLYNPNILINGAFQVNDYNVTSVPSSNTSVVYLTNRWATNSKGLSCSVSSSEHYLRVQASSGCTGLSVFQMIENRDITYEGTTLTLSFYIRGVGTGVGKTVTGRIGSGGGNTGEKRVTLTDSWQYVTSTRTGVYFGSKSDGGVVIYSQDITDVGAGFDISGVKLELGSVATLFAQRSDVEELELCQRYYQKWTGISHTDVPLGNFSVGTGDICSILYLPTPMRTTPSIKSTLTDVELYGCNTAWTAYEAHEPTHLSVYSMSNNTLTLRCRSNGTFAVGSSGIFRIKFGYQYNFILDAELYS